MVSPLAMLFGFLLGLVLGLFLLLLHYLSIPRDKKRTCLQIYQEKPFTVQHHLSEREGWRHPPKHLLIFPSKQNQAQSSIHVNYNVLVRHRTRKLVHAEECIFCLIIYIGGDLSLFATTCLSKAIVRRCLCTQYNEHQQPEYLSFRAAADKPSSLLFPLVQSVCFLAFF